MTTVSRTHDVAPTNVHLSFSLSQDIALHSVLLGFITCSVLIISETCTFIRRTHQHVSFRRRTAENVAARFDLIKQRQDDLKTKFDTITNQLQILLPASHGNPAQQRQTTPPQPLLQATPPATTPKRCLDTSSLEKLQGDISLVDFKTWRNRWDDFGRLNQLSTYLVEEHIAALHLCQDTTMQQAVEVASNFTPNNTSLPSEILGAIANHIRLKRSVALDRIAFEECHKPPTKLLTSFLYD